jgi:hypothetical protein
MVMMLGAVSALGAGAALLWPSSDVVAQKTPNPTIDSAYVASDDHMDDCMRSLRTMYARVTAMPGGDSVCSFTCNVEVDVADTVNFSNSISDVDMILGAGRVEVRSRLFRMVRDSFDVFTVIPESRMIYRGDARGIAGGGANDPAWMRDTVIARSQIVECVDLPDSGASHMRRVLLKPDPAVRQHFDIASMTLLLDMGRGEVRSISVDPFDQGMYTRMTWRFSPLKYTVASAQFKESAAGRFLDGATLRHEWSSYKLVDNRGLAASDAGK